MSWRRKPQATRSIRIGDRGILTMPATYTADQVQETVRAFQQGLRTARVLVAAPGITYTPLPARKRIRMAATERWLTA